MAQGKETILIVEDDPSIARVLDIYLSARGYAVTVASRGRDALEICRATPPDLVLLDIRLPDISGYDVGVALRDSPETQNIPIVVVTAHGEQADRLTAHELVRADYFLVKPFDIEEVHAVVRNQLSEGRRRGQYHPITNLPTGELVNSQLRMLLATRGWSMALIRINGFEQFTQLYGVVVGEEVLKSTALLLAETVREHGHASDFVGQLVVGPYFVLVSLPGRIDTIITALNTRFDARMRLHYSYRDMQQGRVPQMSLAVALISDADGPFSDIRELTVAAERML